MSSAPRQLASGGASGAAHASAALPMQLWRWMKHAAKDSKRALSYVRRQRYIVALVAWVCVCVACSRSDGVGYEASAVGSRGCVRKAHTHTRTHTESNRASEIIARTRARIHTHTH